MNLDNRESIEIIFKNKKNDQFLTFLFSIGKITKTTNNSFFLMKIFFILFVFSPELLDSLFREQLTLKSS